jgi:cyclopropane-fatty-acyl-phospholipid synthase
LRIAQYAWPGCGGRLIYRFKPGRIPESKESFGDVSSTSAASRSVRGCVKVTGGGLIPVDREARDASAGSAGASAEAIRAHYDAGEDFFRLWLGDDLVYSAALFEGGDDLAAAQTRKLDHHIDAAGVRRVARVLDVGCGWGALLRRLTENAGVGHAVGLTLSASQAAWVRGLGLTGVEVREESWREHKADAPYDAIISIGAFEHFAKQGLTGEEKLAAYREFFDFCRANLKMGGRVSLQTIAYVGTGFDLPPFIGEEVFPESELPLVWEPIAAAGWGFELVAFRNDREHYERTLRHWQKNLTARRGEAVAIAGEATVAHFDRYLKISAMAFRMGFICLTRMSFVRRW